jgi:hypothetical protein
MALSVSGDIVGPGNAANLTVGEVMVGLDANNRPTNILYKGGVAFGVVPVSASTGATTLQVWSVQSGIAPTGTVAANGAITLGTALDTTYASGLYLAFPAGALFAGSAAGSYWCVMSSTTLGTAYNNVLSGYPQAPASPTAISDAGPGAYTGITTETTLATLTIPGGSIGTTGEFSADEWWQWNNTAGTKQPRARLGGSVCNVMSAGTTTLGLRSQAVIVAKNSQSAQIGAPFQQGTASASGYTQLAVNMASDTTRTWTGQLNTATDWMILTRVRATVMAA